MDTFFDAGRPLEDRTRALRTLAPVASALAETPYVPQLIDHAEKCGNRDLRLVILQIVGGSLDRRALPLLSTTVAEEQDPIFQMSAAGPLASWNVRDGVGALVKLLNSELMLSETQPLWWGVLGGLEDLNDLKDWGFPITDVKEEVEEIEDFKARYAAYRERWKEWFAENRQRFPDWKAGDPLPEVPAPAKDNPDEE